MADEYRTLESIAVGAGSEHPDLETRDVVSPVHLSSTFELDEPGYPESGYTYGRHGNPTRSALEERLAAMTGATDVRATASGMAAISTVCLSLLSPGDRVVASESLYGGTRTMFDDFLARFGVEATYVDPTDPGAVAAALDGATELVWLESPTNPLLKVPDLAAVGDVVDDHDAVLAVDNTFATPYAQQPLDLGADVSVCSTTKFVNGHSDAVGGAVATDDADLADRFEFVLQDVIGSPMAPFDCYLVLRGLKTLPARMAAHERTATAIAEFLAGHDAVATVNYPGLADHPDHEVAARQLANFGGVVSFELDADGAETRAFVEDLSVPTLAMSLGGVETLVEHTASMSAATLSPAERAAAGVSDSLVRLSVGLESADDLLDDLERALAVVE